MVTTQVSSRAFIIKNVHPNIDDVLALALSNEESFSHTKICEDGIFQKSISVDRENYRGESYQSSELKALLLSTMKIVISHREEILARFRIKKLYFGGPSVFLTRMGDGDFLIRHSDLRKIAGPNFELIVLLYFYAEPKSFSGGELELFWKDGTEVIEPENNMLVIFPASVEHAVKTVLCPTKIYADSRFVVVGRFYAPLTTLQQVSRLIRFFTRIAKNMRKKLERSIVPLM